MLTTLLRRSDIEKAFLKVVMDLKMILVLDGIYRSSDPPEFRIHSHDLYGPLPEILIRDTGDRYHVLDNLQGETAKLCAMVRVRDDIATIFPGCNFLLPTRTDEGSVVGIRFTGRSFLAEHMNCWEAYHKLQEEAVRKIL